MIGSCMDSARAGPAPSPGADWSLSLPGTSGGGALASAFARPREGGSVRWSSESGVTMPQPIEESGLEQRLEAVRQGDQPAARVLVERLYPLVIRIVRGHLPEPSAEDDLAQEVFLKLFAKLNQYEVRAGVPFEHWVSRLAVRTCLDGLRAKRRRPEIPWGDLPEGQRAWLEFMLTDESAPPDASPASARELVEKLLSQLAPADRLVISLLDLEQRSVQEVSALTGWNRTLVKVRAFRARQKLKKLARALPGAKPL
jgi:RNA polymerase sigma factor (sigma-70 family)